MSKNPHRSGVEFERQVLEELTATLAQAFGSDASVQDLAGQLFSSPDYPEPDGLIEITTPGKTLMICVEVKKEVYPRDIRDAVWKLNNYLRFQDHRQETIGMLAAGSLSPGAKDELKAHNIAYFEPGGSLYLKH